MNQKCQKCVHYVADLFNNTIDKKEIEMKAIISADWHLRSDRPRYRLDEDWMTTQIVQMKHIARIVDDTDTILCIVGDLFDRAIVSERIKTAFLKFVNLLPESVYIIAGNHCLPYHSWSNEENSSFGVIWASGKVKHLNELGKSAHFGEELSGKDNDILFIHRLVFETAKDLPPNVNASTAEQLLEEFPDAKWIFTGDNHHHFHYEKDGRHVINPGCINRQSADMISYQPIVYHVDTDANFVEEIALIDDVKMITDEYLRTEEARETRISAFVESVRSSENVSLDFLGNLNMAIKENPDIEKSVIRTITEIVEENK